jgi:hypothetical protein
MLQLVPSHWFSWDFTVRQGSEILANIDVSWWSEKGVLTIQGTRFLVYREGFFSGYFVLESGDTIVARARKPSAFLHSFIVEHAGKQYTLRQHSALGRPFQLLDGDREVGSITQEVFTDRASVGMPQDMPLPVQVFIAWLVIILWKRDANAA